MPKKPEQWWKNLSIDSSSSGYTGLGPDNKLQSSARAGALSNGMDKHEGEYVFDAQTTNAIGPDVLEALRTNAQAGRIDPNKLRQAIGIPNVPGMQTGGFAADTSIAPPPTNSPLPTAAASFAPGATGSRATNFSADLGATGPGVTNFSTDLNDPSAPVNITSVPQQPAGIGITGLTKEAFDPGKEKLKIYDPMTREDFDPGKEKLKIYGDGQADTTEPDGVGMQALRGIALGESPAFRTQANLIQRQIAAQGAAQQQALGQQLAQQGITGGQAMAARAGLTRDISAGQADAAAQTALGAQREIAGAAANLASLELAEGKFAYQQDMDKANALLQSGDVEGYAKAFNDMHGTDLDTTVLQNDLNRTNFTEGNAMVDTLLIESPDMQVTASEMDAPLQQVWEGMGKEGNWKDAENGEQWASNFIERKKLAADPLYQLSNNYSREGAEAIFGADAIENFPEIQDLAGNTLSGWDAAKYALGQMSLSNGIKITDGNFEFDETNPWLQMFYGGIKPSVPEGVESGGTWETGGQTWKLGDDGEPVNVSGTQVGANNTVSYDGNIVSVGGNSVTASDASPTGYVAGDTVVNYDKSTGEASIMEYKDSPVTKTGNSGIFKAGDTLGTISGKDFKPMTYEGRNVEEGTLVSLMRGQFGVPNNVYSSGNTLVRYDDETESFVEYDFENYKNDVTGFVENDALEPWVRMGDDSAIDEAEKRLKSAIFNPDNPLAVSESNYRNIDMLKGLEKGDPLYDNMLSSAYKIDGDNWSTGLPPNGYFFVNRDGKLMLAHKQEVRDDGLLTADQWTSKHIYYLDIDALPEEPIGSKGLVESALVSTDEVRRG